MASGLVHYTVSDADVQLIPQIGLGRRGRRMPVAAGEEYPAVVTRCPTPEFPGDNTVCDLMVFLNGTTLDYEVKLMQHGFKFVNPQEATGCGCGESFGV